MCHKMPKRVWVAALSVCVAFGVSAHSVALAVKQSAAQGDRVLINRYCVTCHNDQRKTGGLSLADLDPSDVRSAPEIWEKVVRKLRTASMPPPRLPRPEDTVLDALVARLEAALDRRADVSPNPGSPTVHRLNRSQYVNAVRDLFGVELDGSSMLPADNVVEGFDNIAGGLTVSPLLMERYLSVAKRVSRIAVGDPTIGPGFEART